MITLDAEIVLCYHFVCAVTLLRRVIVQILDCHIMALWWCCGKANKVFTLHALFFLELCCGYIVHWALSVLPLLLIYFILFYFILFLMNNQTFIEKILKAYNGVQKQKPEKNGGKLKKGKRNTAYLFIFIFFDTC